MVARTPDIGGLKENPLRICLSGGMVWLSIYKAADGSMAENTFADMVSGSMDSPLIRTAFKMKKKTAFTLKAQQFRKDTSERTNQLSKDNSFQWNAEVILGRDADEYRINYRQCGLCALGRQEGLLHLVKHMCVLDTMSIDWMGGVLYRTKTLANGGDCCDFHICKKGSQWDREAQA
ncbi:MAG: L-2-amino-thiazoline-4-carboxylic acid hydrolase [Clostridia bacterium]|nr:L-2-amino-thiazoline-4-carboxylic acid hydrolase [Clostridia bacterium]